MIDPNEEINEELSTEELKSVSGGYRGGGGSGGRISKEGKDLSFSELSDISRNIQDKKKEKNPNSWSEGDCNGCT